MKDITAIIVPSGNFEQDIARAEKGYKLGGRDAHYVLSGLGPDTNEALERLNRGESVKGLDFHPELWEYFKTKYEKGEIGIFGIGTSALNTEGNLEECLPEGQKGKYAWVSFPGHNWKTKFLEKRLKRTKQIDKDARIDYINTESIFSQGFYGWGYGILSIAKELLKPPLSYVK